MFASEPALSRAKERPLVLINIGACILLLFALLMSAIVVAYFQRDASPCTPLSDWDALNTLCLCYSLYHDRLPLHG